MKPILKYLLVGVVVAGALGAAYFVKKKKDAEHAFQTMTQAVATVKPGLRPEEVAVVEQAVQAYVGQAEPAYATAVQSDLATRKQAWHVERKGNVALKVEPEQAVITLGSLASPTNPALFRDVKIGEYPLKATAAGYEPMSRQAKVEPESTANLGEVALVAIKGKLRLASEPAGLEYALRSENLVAEDLKHSSRGRTPAELDLPLGSYRVTFLNPGWAEKKQAVTVTVESDATAKASFVPATVTIETTPAGLPVRLSGSGLKEPVSTPSPLELKLSPGSYVYETSRQGWSSIRKEFTVAEAETAAFTESFPTGSIKLESEPAGADAVMNGKTLGKAPLSVGDLKPGQYRFVLTLDGYKETTATIDLNGGGGRALKVKMNEFSGPKKAVDFVNRLGMGMHWSNKGYWIAKRPFRHDLYERLTGQPVVLQYGARARQNNKLIVNITQEEMRAFISRLNSHEQEGGMLPEGFAYRLPRPDEMMNIFQGRALPIRFVGYDSKGEDADLSSGFAEFADGVIIPGNPTTIKWLVEPKESTRGQALGFQIFTQSKENPTRQFISSVYQYEFEKTAKAEDLSFWVILAPSGD